MVGLGSAQLTEERTRRTIAGSLKKSKKRNTKTAPFTAGRSKIHQLPKDLVHCSKVPKRIPEPTKMSCQSAPVGQKQKLAGHQEFSLSGALMLSRALRKFRLNNGLSDRIHIKLHLLSSQWCNVKKLWIYIVLLKEQKPVSSPFHLGCTHFHTKTLHAQP